jgi:DNA-directed RNA polymerase specialized sigma24 family protein
MLTAGPRSRRSAAPRAAGRRAAGRQRLQSALACRAAYERTVLALLLYEQLTPVEAARALGVSVQEIHRTYHALRTALRAALCGTRGATNLRRAA